MTDQVEPGEAPDTQRATILHTLDLAITARRHALEVLLYAAEVYTEASKVYVAARAAVLAGYVEVPGLRKPGG